MMPGFRQQTSILMKPNINSDVSKDGLIETADAGQTDERGHTDRQKSGWANILIAQTDEPKHQNVSCGICPQF